MTLVRHTKHGILHYLFGGSRKRTHVAVKVLLFGFWWRGYCGAPPSAYLIFVLFLAEVDFDSLLARFVRNYDLLWHFITPFVLCFYFYQFRTATRSLALLARGLITNSLGSATMGFLVFKLNSDSSPWLEASLK